MIEEHPLLWLGVLCALIAVSGFFSASETGLMALNRYKLQHLVRKKHKRACRVDALLKRTDRLLGVILIGNTFANILASAFATMIAVQVFGELGVVVATVLLTVVVLIFAEIMPKTLAALYPERIAFFVARPLAALLTLLHPFVWVANSVVNGVLKLFNIHVCSREVEPLSREELRSLLTQSDAGRAFRLHQSMLLGILDLEKVAVEDIMVPRREVIGVDLSLSWPAVLEQLRAGRYARLLVYQDSLEQVKGVIHARDLLYLSICGKLDIAHLLRAAEEVPFIPEGTLLSTQLINFQEEKYRVGLVVDEYGAVKGLITLEDILEEIVGEFCTDLSGIDAIRKQRDGSFLVHGALSIRDLNRAMRWSLPTEEGPNTLSGLIVEHLEMMPQVGVCVRIGGHSIEIMRVANKRVQQARIYPAKVPEASKNNFPGG